MNKFYFNNKIIGIIGIAIIIIIILLISIFIMGNQGNNEDNSIIDNYNITTTNDIHVTSGSIDFNGGNITVDDKSSPLYGLNINLPQGATYDTVNFDISYSNVTEINGLPETASISSKMISIETEGNEIWNEYKSFNKPIEIILPYDSTLVSENETVRYYTYDEENKILSSAGFNFHDKTNHTISFYTRSFSSFIAVKLSLKDYEYFGKNFSIDTGFRPKTDGFYIGNEGSYLESGGFCMGMVSFARFYYMYKKGIDGIGLYEKYREGDREEWRDDATAIELATRAHIAELEVWNQISNKELDIHIPSSKDVAISWIHGMIVTGSPQLIGIYQQVADGDWVAGHAIMTYKYSNGRFDIYDPNFPGTEPGTDVRQIPFTYKDGFSRDYSSGTTATTGDYKYNIFLHWGFKTFHPINAFNQLYYSAQNGFEDNSIFPTVSLTNYGSDGSTPTDTDGDGIRDTPECKATISGTITGGQKAVTSTLIFVSNQKFKTPVDSNGKFSQEVPLFAGKNDLIILATDQDTFSNWSGYLKDSIDSTGSKSAFTLTLTLEPNEAFGQHQEKLVVDVPSNCINMDKPPAVGDKIKYNTPDGKEVLGKILEIYDNSLKVDFNHPLAGKKIVFIVTIYSIVNT